MQASPTPGQPAKESMVIPLSLGLLDKTGRNLPLMLSDGSGIEHGVLVLSEPEGRYEFTGIAERPVYSINREFSAPIKLVTDLADDDLAFLAAKDSDPFNRWQALQTISMRTLIGRQRARGSIATQRRQADAGACIILEDAALEPAFIALALVPGRRRYRARIGYIDPDAIAGLAPRCARR
jgi:aminopeptidase N